MNAELPAVPVGTIFELPDEPQRIVAMVLASAVGRLFVEVAAIDRSDRPAGLWVVDDDAVLDGSWPIVRSPDTAETPAVVPRFATDSYGRPAFATYSQSTITVTGVEPIGPADAAEFAAAPNLNYQDVASFLWSVRQTFELAAASKRPTPEAPAVAEARKLVALWRRDVTNVDVPLEIEFFADFRSVAAARRAAADSALSGATVAACGPFFRRSASVAYRESIVPRYPLVAAASRRFEDRVAIYGGIYDGMGAAIK